MKPLSGVPEQATAIRTRKTQVPALWEKGGGYTNTGEAIIITDDMGRPKPAVYLQTWGDRACLNHALIPIHRNDYIIEAEHQREEFTIKIYRIHEISEELKTGAIEYVRGKPHYFDHPLLWIKDFAMKHQLSCTSDMTLYLINKFENGEWWDEDLAEEFEEAIQAAKDKATCYHCREPHYIQPKEAPAVL
jgi:hypothetical protein